MNLWRLEVARLVRTCRWIVLAGVFGFFAVGGPLLARYLEQFLQLAGGGVVVQVPPQGPADGIGQYVDGISQTGVLAVVVVASAALAMDARPELAAYLRTRVTGVRALLLPRYLVVVAASVAVLVLGMAVAWLLTVVLLGAPAAGPILLGTLYTGVYLGFAVAVVAAVAGFTRGVVGVIFASVAVLLGLALVARIPAIRPFMPTELLSAVPAQLHGTPATDLLGAAAVAIVAIVGLLALAEHRLARREL